MTHFESLMNTLQAHVNEADKMIHDWKVVSETNESEYVRKKYEYMVEAGDEILCRFKSVINTYKGDL